MRSALSVRPHDAAMATAATNPGSAAIRGALLLLPFLAANAIVANRIEPFFSLIRPGIHTSPQEYVLLVTVVLLIAGGAFVAGRPLCQKGLDGKRHFYVANAVLATLLGAIFIVLSVALGSEIYRCDILGIPNCD
jgi:hypothetical protein